MTKEWKPNPDKMFDDFGEYIKWKAEQDKKTGKDKAKNKNSLAKRANLPDDIAKRKAMK